LQSLAGEPRRAEADTQFVLGERGEPARIFTHPLALTKFRVPWLLSTKYHPTPSLPLIPTDPMGLKIVTLEGAPSQGPPERAPLPEKEPTALVAVRTILKEP